MGYKKPDLSEFENISGYDLWLRITKLKRGRLKTIVYYFLDKKKVKIKLYRGRANKTILMRDNYACRLCFSTDDVQVHHITPLSLGGFLTSDNCITLCNKCHHFIHYCNPMLRLGIIGQDHSRLTKEGLRKAKMNGKTLGRPKKN